MKKFITQILQFIFILIIILLSNYFINSIIFKNQKSLIRDTNILIVGDSHTQRSINPILFASAINISQAAEPYYLSYWKLKNILSNTKIDTVILGFGRHNLSSFNDQKLSNEKWSSEMYNRMYYIENIKALKNIDIDYSEYFKSYIKNMCIYPKFKHDNFIGEFIGSEKKYNSDADKIIAKHFYYGQEYFDISDNQISYLDSIINICSNKNIELILFSAPVHNDYYKLIPEKFKLFFNSEKSRIKKMSLMFIDFSNMNYPDKYFINSDHLNVIGSRETTLQLFKAINDK